MKHILWSAVLLAHTATAATVILQPSKDNTLFEDSQGTFSNGAGVYMYAGATGAFGGNMLRRAVIAFDIASTIPAGATIESVSLTLYISNPASVSPVDIKLHALLADWGEGISNSGPNGGTGVDSAPGDATWIHPTFDTARWTTPGGDFAPIASAQTSAGVPGSYQFSDPKMLADVKAWFASPIENFGWIILGNETGSATARRIGTRENPELNERPALTVTYTVPEPHAGVLLVGGVALLCSKRTRRRQKS